MSMNTWIRQTHRWLSIVFTLAVAANIAALMLKRQEFWIGLLALVPLILMLVTGLYLFIQPYVARAGQRGG